jgi:hypothetical protein
MAAKRKRSRTKLFFPLHPQRAITLFFLAAQIHYFPRSVVDRLLKKHDLQFCRCTVGSEWGRLSPCMILSITAVPYQSNELAERELHSSMLLNGAILAQSVLLPMTGGIWATLSEPGSIGLHLMPRT